MDVVLIHDPDEHEDAAFSEAYPALERLRGEGVVRAIGAGMNQSAMLTRFVRETDVDLVLWAGRYTVLDHSAASAFCLQPRTVKFRLSRRASTTPGSWRASGPRTG